MVISPFVVEKGLSGMGHLLWGNFAFMMFSVAWLLYTKKNPDRMLGRTDTPHKRISLTLAPWVLGVVAAGNGVLWLSPLYVSR